MRGSFRLGRVAGIGIFIHWTFAILIAFIIFSNYRKGHDATQTSWSVLFVLSIFVTVFLHELGHAMAAKRYNIATRDITILPIGGLARLESMPEKPSEELVVAIAGPLVNIVIAIITGAIINFPDPSELPALMEGGVNASNFFLNFFIVNLWLALFNLIPAFPMDGGRVLRALLSIRFQRHVATRIAARIGQLLAVGFVFAGFFLNPFLVFIGLFIFLGAQSEAEFTQAQSMLRGHRVADALMKEFQALQVSDTVQRAIQLLLNGQSKNFVVMDGEIAVGTLSRDEMIRSLTETGEGTLVGAIMNRELVILSSNMPLEEAYKQAQQHRPALMLVQDHGRFVGTLDTENILEFVMVRSAIAARKN